MAFTVFFIVLEITVAILVWKIPSGDAVSFRQSVTNFRRVQVEIRKFD